MNGEGPKQGASGIASVGEYEARLKASMRLVARTTREAVVKEIVTGVTEQVRAGGGDFGRVAPSLDQPGWVGRQMVKVYGVAPWVKAVGLALACVLALASVPGVALQPADSGAAVLLALLAFAALVVVLFLAATLLSVPLAALAASLAAALRVVGFLLPQAALAPIDAASTGETTLFLVSTAFLFVVALAPGVAVRLRGAED